MHSAGYYSRPSLLVPNKVNILSLWTHRVHRESERHKFVNRGEPVDWHMHMHKLAVVAKNLVNILMSRNMVQNNDKAIRSDFARMNVAAGVFSLGAQT